MPIQQTGNNYRLTSAVKGSIEVDRSNTIFDGNGYSLSGILISGLNITVKNCVIEGGVQFGQIHEGVVAGIKLSDASNAIVTNNTISGVLNFVAVFAYYEKVAGIIVAGGGSNVISSNNLSNNWQGMVFSDTSHNLILANNVTSNLTEKTGYSEPGGIYFDNSSNNTVFHNNFMVNIGGQAKDSYFNSVNIWDGGYPIGGNYWSDYQKQFPNTIELDNSGVGNTSYVIDELNAELANNTDRYPLMDPFNSTFEALQASLPEIMFVSPLNQTYNDSKVTLLFSVNVLSPIKSVNWAGYSLDSEPNITLTAYASVFNVTISNMTAGLHHIEVYANDTYGNINSQTVNFTIAKPKIESIQIALVAAVSIIAVAAGVLIYLKKHKHSHS